MSSIAIVSGSREARHRDWTFEQLDALDRERPIAVVIEGGQRAFDRETREIVGGVDHFANAWAAARGRYAVTIAADWETHGRRAGPIRNGAMLRVAPIDFLVAFPGGDGTADMMDQALAAGVEIEEIARRARFVYVPVLAPALCRARPDALHVFGDNLQRYGKKGQACIRDEPNAIGIPTKRAPREDADAYFRDADLETFRTAAALPLGRLRRHLEAGGTVFWPENGIGTGLAQLQIRAPRLFFALERAEARLVEIARQRPAPAIPGAFEPREIAA